MARAPLLACLVSGCSLVYGLHDNQGPIDAAPNDAGDAAPSDAGDAAPNDAATPNGCPDGSLSHTFCEYFDETSTWPDAGTMSPTGTWSLSSTGCNTPPRCLTTDNGTTGGAQRTLPWPSGAKQVTLDWEARIDQLSACTTAVGRTAWVTFTTSAVAGGVVIGNTYCQGATDGLFLFWASSVTNGVGNRALMPASAGSFYHLHLVVDVSVQEATLTAVSTTNSAAAAFAADMNLPASFASSISSVQIDVGGLSSSGGAALGDTVDTVFVDIN